MKVAYIFPGSGGTFYCSTCIRDAFLVPALRDIGHDVVIVPLYLPLFGHEDLCRADVPIFYGAVNVYLRHVVPFMRKAPRWIQYLLDRKPILGLAASRAGSTRASGLVDMTVSMLSGSDGDQKEELERMTSWLEEHLKPDIIHLSNALLLGLAKTFRERLGVPIVCSLQDEHQWIGSMGPEGEQRVWKVMSEQAQSVDAFISTSHYYADMMIDTLGLDEERVDVVYPGVDPDSHVPSTSRPTRPTLGYLSRMSVSLGLDLVAEAYMVLKQRKGLEDLCLKVIGGQTNDDNTFIEELKSTFESCGMLEDVEFIDGFGADVRATFFNDISVLTVPVPNGEAFGIYLIEALAAGVPVVQPAQGAFTEIIEKTDGGILYEPGEKEALADALEPVLLDNARAAELGRRGRKKVLENFTAEQMARQTAEIYRKLMPVHSTYQRKSGVMSSEVETSKRSDFAEISRLRSR